MKRPLMFCCLCFVAAVAVRYFILCPPDRGGPPDGTKVTIIGKICGKDDKSFVIKIQSNAIQDNLIQDNLIQEKTIQNNLNTQYNSYNQNNSDILINSNFNNNSKNIFNSDKLNSIKLLCDCENAEQLIIGSTVLAEGNYYGFTPAGNPGEFDYARYYHSIGYAGRLKNLKIVASDECAPGLREMLSRLRDFWEERLYNVFPEKEASIMTAILLGDKSGVDSDVKSLYRRNGIIHILSISGLHITILGMGLYKILRKIGVPIWAAACAGGIFLLLYGIMTGLGVSVCRAVGMYILRMTARLIGRTYDMLTAMAVMAAAMVCVNPAWLEHMGFMLSFGSVLGVGVLFPALSYEGSDAVRERKYVDGRYLRWFADKWDGLRKNIKQSLLAGISITLTTLPLQLLFSYEIPVYSVLLNILILPLMGAVVVFGLAAMMIPGLGIVGTADIIILTFYENLCGLFDKLPHPMWNPGRQDVWQTVLYYVLWGAAVGLVKIIKCSHKTKKGIMTIKCMQFIALVLAVFVIGFHGRNSDMVTFLDVGQGDCACVRLSSGEVYLFDCGSSSRKKIGENVLVPYLKYYGIQRIDAVFLSHADIDHTNGILELLEIAGDEHLDVGQIVIPAIESKLRKEEFREVLDVAERGGGIPVTAVRAGEEWRSSDNTDAFLCLHPLADGKSMGGNSGSECFYIELGEGSNRISLLFTGDVEGEGEKNLYRELTDRDIGAVTVLKVAHHGSKNSTSKEILAQINPGVSVISCARNNKYGHPHEELVERLEETGTIICNTSYGGAVMLELNKKELKVWQWNR